MLIDLNSYKFSATFGSIFAEMKTVENSFIEYLDEGLILVQRKEEALESFRSRNVSDSNLGNNEYGRYYYESEKNNIYYLERSFFYSSVSYIFTQFEIKLIEILGYSKMFFKIENELNYDMICQNIRKEKLDIKGIFNKIKTTTEISFENILEVEWQILDDFKEVRNIIVHHNGVTIETKIQKVLSRKINREKGLNSKWDQIIITKEYLLFVLSKICSFIDSVIEIIWEKHQKLQNGII